MLLQYLPVKMLNTVGKPGRVPKFISGLPVCTRMERLKSQGPRLVRLAVFEDAVVETGTVGLAGMGVTDGACACCRACCSASSAASASCSLSFVFVSVRSRSSNVSRLAFRYNGEAFQETLGLPLDSLGIRRRSRKFRLCCGRSCPAVTLLPMSKSKGASSTT